MGMLSHKLHKKHVVFFLMEFGIGQLYLHYMTGCQLYEHTVEMPTPI